MKKFKIILIIFVSLSIILAVSAYTFLFFQPPAAAKQVSAAKPVEDIYFSNRPDFVIHAELAQTPDAWTRGLMFRTSMPADSGMLFVFPAEAAQSFWMKNTKIPLDMLFISAAGKIVDIKNYFLPCLDDPCPVYNSSAPAQYVLEINGGLAQRKGIQIGDEIKIRK